MRLTNSSSYLFHKRGVYYFSRRIPTDLRHHYNTDRIVFSMKTKALRIANARAISLAAKLEEEWLTLRLQARESSLSRFLITRSGTTGAPSTAPLLSEARDIYLSAKADGRAKTFEQAAHRCVGFAIDLLGNRPIDTFTRPELIAQDPIIPMAAQFALQTGCRRSEQLRLDWLDYDQSGGTIWLADAKNGRGRHILLTEGAQEGALFVGAAPITLIDGQRLLELCVKHQVGLKRRSVEIHEIDDAFFAEKFTEEELVNSSSLDEDGRTLE